MTCSDIRPATLAARKSPAACKAAAEGAFVARLGGDEFTLIVAERAAARDRGRWPNACTPPSRDDIEIDGHSAADRPQRSASRSIRPTAPTPTTLLANADAALYRAKAEGRGSIRFFEPDMDKRLRERRALQQDLRSAIERDELALHYQPQALIGGEIIGFEALLRWQHPRAAWFRPAPSFPWRRRAG